MRRKECDGGICCSDFIGIGFGSSEGSDLYIGNSYNNSSIHNDGTGGYECHPEYKKSLFVNTAGPNEDNYFTYMECEVYSLDYGSRQTIDLVCKYPDIIWECIKTRNISNSSLEKVNDELALLNDLNAIQCKNNRIRVKVSRHFLKHPSKFLPNTQIVDQHYDEKLKEWLGIDHKWKLLYRASEHRYTAKSFYKYCKNVIGPILVIIKSSEGWIFGGYAYEAWQYNCIYILLALVLNRSRT